MCLTIITDISDTLIMDAARAQGLCLGRIWLFNCAIFLSIFWCFLMLSLVLSAWQCKSAGQLGGPFEYRRDVEKCGMYQDIDLNNCILFPKELNPFSELIWGV